VSFFVFLKKRAARYCLPVLHRSFSFQIIGRPKRVPAHSEPGGGNDLGLQFRLKILVFYLVFYGFLAAIFIGTIQVLLLTISEFEPKYQDRVAPPGLSTSPITIKTELKFQPSVQKSYEVFVKHLDNLLSEYSLEKQEEKSLFETCGEIPLTYTQRGNFDESNGQKGACKFDRRWLANCSGIDDTTYGYSTGKPCIIAKLNRIFKFLPQPPDNGTEIPEDLSLKYNQYIIPIHCHVKREEDKDKLGPVEYYGMGGFGGFPLHYYPYYGKRLHSNYLQPLVAIQFTNVTMNEPVRIECKAYGKNIGYSEKDRFQGRFDVKIEMNS
uniref:Sodium/potassium-transporting ATPase subunit beta n=1 Tax=Callorhinchus milii TaxID=7868 RepID=A0A4W3H8R6_CALMI